MHRLSEFTGKNKTSLLRVDLNVPVLDGKILDHTRIDKIIPTIKYLDDLGSKIILASHFGRPKGIPQEIYSLRFLINELSQKTGKEVIFAENLQNAQSLAKSLKTNQILLLENLRFDKREEKNDPAFARELAALANFYVNDAFSCSHRAHASIAKIQEFLPSYTGLLLEEEISNLELYLQKPKKPMMAIIGGSKVSTKIGLIRSLLEKVDYLVIGGAMANTFLKAKNLDIGNSFYEDEFVEIATELINNPKIILPLDAIIADKIAEDAEGFIVEIGADKRQKMILDIGPQTIAHIINLLEKCETLVMNGPLGVFEYTPFATGTLFIIKAIELLTQTKQLISVAGGGDTIASLAKINANFTYKSTAGGAFLEWLEGKKLPGLNL